MNVHSVRRALAVAAATAIAATLVAAPAVAETRTVADTRGEVTSGADIYRVRVDHALRVRVTIKLDDIVPDFLSDAGASVYVDTNRATRGPDFVLGTPLFEGSDYAMWRTQGWTAVGQPLTCFHNVRLDFDNDVARVVFGRGCLGNPEKVRVGVKVVSGGEGGGTDWLVKRRYLTPAVAQG